MALDGFLFHEHIHLLSENIGSFREFLLLSLWNLISDNSIWCSLTPILRETVYSWGLSHPWFTDPSHTLSWLWAFQAEESVYSATPHGEAVPYPWSPVSPLSSSTACLLRYEGKSCLQHSKNWSTINLYSGIMMLSVFYSFLNTYFFQPWLNTDIFITTPTSFASHEVNSSSLLDFSFYDPEKPNIITKFGHQFPASSSTSSTSMLISAGAWAIHVLCRKAHY